MAARALLAVAMAAAVVAVASAQSSSSGCTQTLIGMSPCLGYITGNSTKPSSSCCSQLASVVKSQPECLCVALNADPAALGLGSVNKTRAVGLPDECSVKTPPLSNCNSGAAPTTSPSAGTPAGQTPTAAGAGSKTTPTTDIGSGVAPSLRGIAGIVAGLVVAAVSFM